MKKRIIDNRKKEKYMVDDEYLNGMARLCGWKATIVYNSLCRHASKEQECFPSIQKMAEQHNVHRTTIIKGIEALEARNVIQVEKKRTQAGNWLNNTYTLVDKTEWIYDQVAQSDTDTQVAHNDHPSRSQRLHQVAHNDTKETHNQGNTYKETHNCEQSSQADSCSLNQQEDTPFDEQDYLTYLEKMRNDNNRHIRVISIYLKKLYRLYGRQTFESDAERKEVIKRHCKAAKSVGKFTNDKIRKALDTALEKVGEEATLETVYKYLTK